MKIRLAFLGLTSVASGLPALPVNASDLLGFMGESPSILQEYLAKNDGGCKQIRLPEPPSSSNLHELNRYVPQNFPEISDPKFPFPSVSCSIFGVRIFAVLSGGQPDPYRIVRLDFEYGSVEVADKFLALQDDQNAGSAFISYSSDNGLVTVQRALADRIDDFSSELGCARVGWSYLSNYGPEGYTCSVSVSAIDEVIVIRRFFFKKYFFKKVPHQDSSMTVMSGNYFYELGKLEEARGAVSDRQLRARQEAEGNQRGIINFLSLD